MRYLLNCYGSTAIHDPCMNVYSYICMYVHMYVCICIYVVCMYVCMLCIYVVCMYVAKYVC